MKHREATARDIKNFERIAAEPKTAEPKSAEPRAAADSTEPKPALALAAKPAQKSSQKHTRKAA